MAIEHKTRQMKQRTRIIRDPKDMKKPQELQEEDIARQENETTKNVMQISEILEELDQKVNLFHLVINPESFGQTVENIFYLSFLVRDGKVSITEEDMDDPNRGNDEDDEMRETREGANMQPMVELCETPTAEDYQGGLLKKQMVMDIDMATWRVCFFLSSYYFLPLSVLALTFIYDFQRCVSVGTHRGVRYSENYDSYSRYQGECGERQMVRLDGLAPRLDITIPLVFSHALHIFLKTQRNVVYSMV
jgi:hypothetical protein